MQCYQTLAAITLVSRIIDKLQGSEQFRNPSVVATWMETQGIEIEDVLPADRRILEAQLAALLDREKRNRIRNAA